MAAGASVNGTVVRNGVGLPVPSGFDGLFDNGVELVSEAGAAGIGVDVVEEFVQVGFAQALEFAAIIGSSSLRVEDEVEEGSSAGSDPRVFDVVGRDCTRWGRPF